MAFNQRLGLVFAFVTVATVTLTAAIVVLEAPAWALYVGWALISLVAGLQLARHDPRLNRR